MRAATSLIGEVDGVHSACIWELGRDGRRLNLRAGLEDEASAPAAASPPPATPTPAPPSTRAPHAIVDDWTSESRFSMPPVCASRRRSSLAVMIDGKDHPFGVLDVHATEPHRFTPKDVDFVQAAANVLADAIERHAADEALRYRVLHDSLTGLPNRLSFVDSLDRGAEAGDRSGSPIGILFLDLDHFKLINDSLGHHAGDELLGAVAPRLRAHLRPGDVVARFGGDEFGDPRSSASPTKRRRSRSPTGSPPPSPSPSRSTGSSTSSPPASASPSPAPPSSAAPAPSC